jgi:uncharacterized membrane protein YkvA (DUF1232 family)
MAENEEDFSDAYSDGALWKKIGRFALRAGRQLIEKILTLYFCLRDSDTPTWAKAVILSALAYFILPLDAIPDAIPGAGLTDDAGYMAAALAMVAAHVKPEHRERARENLKTWFGTDEDRPPASGAEPVR